MPPRWSGGPARRPARARSIGCGGGSASRGRKKTLTAAERDTPAGRAARADFRAWAADLDPTRLIFLDEFGVNLGFTRTHARAPRGERAHGSAPINPDPNVTWIFGLGLRGVLAPWAFEGPMDGEAYVAYARTQLAPHLRPGDVVIADGLGAHRSGAARAVIEATGATYRLLPPYSPDLTPIENAGSVVKRAVRADAPRTVRRLYASMGRAMQRLMATEIWNYFAHAGYVPRAAPGKPSDAARGPPL